MASYLDGTHGPADKVVPLALARLEKMIESRLGEVLDDDVAPVVKVQVFENTSSDGESPGDFPLGPDHYKSLVDSILDSIGHAVGTQANPDEGGEVIHLQAYHGNEPNSVPTHCDFFGGRLRCMSCGVVSRDDDSTNCETFLRPEPSGELLTVGSFIGPIIETVRSDYYSTARDRQKGRDIHILEGWECSHCEALNWAEIVVENDVIKSIWSVTLNLDSLERAHLISSESVELASQITGRPPWTLIDEDILAILIDRL